MSLETLSYAQDTKAVKDHQCNFCGQKIRIGEIYENSTHKYDGRVYDWKTHKHCQEIAVRLKMYNDIEECGLTEDDFVETIQAEHFRLLVALIPDEEAKKYSDIIQQLRYVMFKDQLAYVIRYYKKLDQNKK